MKTLKTFVASCAIVFSVFAPGMALAVTTPSAAGTNPISASLNTAAKNTGLSNPCTGASSISSCIAGIIGNIIGIVLGFVEVILFLLFIYSGFLWMTSGGDEKQVAKAKAMIFNAVAGLIIIGLSYLLTSFIVTEFTTTVVGSGTEAESTAPTP